MIYRVPLCKLGKGTPFSKDVFITIFPQIEVHKHDVNGADLVMTPVYNLYDCTWYP